jgi:hypothetical protein
MERSFTRGTLGFPDYLQDTIGYVTIPIGVWKDLSSTCGARTQGSLAIKCWNMDFEAVGEKRKMQILELEEWREKAYHSSKLYKERTRRWHDKRIKKKFAPRDKVLLFNSRVKLFGHIKLWSKWEGPFTVVYASSHGAVTLRIDKGTLFKVNGQCLKIFLEPIRPSEAVDELDFIILPQY